MLGKETDLQLELTQSLNPLNYYQQMKQQNQPLKKINMDLKMLTTTKSPTRQLINSTIIPSQKREVQTSFKISNMNSQFPRAMSSIPLSESRKNSQLNGVRLTSMFPKARGLVTSGEMAGGRRSTDLRGFGAGVNSTIFGKKRLEDH